MNEALGTLPPQFSCPTIHKYYTNHYGKSDTPLPFFIKKNPLSPT